MGSRVGHFNEDEKKKEEQSSAVDVVVVVVVVVVVLVLVDVDGDVVVVVLFVVCFVVPIVGVTCAITVQGREAHVVTISLNRVVAIEKKNVSSSQLVESSHVFKTCRRN